MRQRRAFRWTLFFLAALCFIRFVFLGGGTLSLTLFFIFGGSWYWLERRKMRELDAPHPR